MGLIEKAWFYCSRSSKSFGSVKGTDEHLTSSTAVIIASLSFVCMFQVSPSGARGSFVMEQTWGFDTDRTGETLRTKDLAPCARKSIAAGKPADRPQSEVPLSNKDFFYIHSKDALFPPHHSSSSPKPSPASKCSFTGEWWAAPLVWLVYHPGDSTSSKWKIKAVLSGLLPLHTRLCQLRPKAGAAVQGLFSLSTQKHLLWSYSRNHITFVCLSLCLIGGIMSKPPQGFVEMFTADWH